MLPLYKPYMPELPEMDKILHSGQLAYGRYTKEFEAALRNYFNNDSLIVTNSFNTAISVAVSSIGLRAGDEIIASPMACLASTQPYESNELKIVWADIDPHTGTLDPDAVRSKITGKTRCIIHNHFCGYPGYIDEINAIGREYGIKIIDDGIECFGTEYKGKRIGNCGTDVTVFSFNPVRIPNTIDGGAIIYRDDKYLEKSILIRDCGIDRSKFRDDIGEIDPQCDISFRGFSATMSNVNGYIGAEQMKYAEQLIEKQRINAKIWDKYIDGRKYRSMKSENGLPNYWVYGLLADDKRATIEQFREKGFYASGVHMKNNIYSVFDNREPLLGVDDFFSRFVALPCGWWTELKEEKINA